MKSLPTIKLIIFDVDGVMTDGKLYFGENGEALKAFNVQDGIGLKMLLENGIDIAVITGRKSAMVTTRMQELGIEHVYQGQTNKLEAFKHCCKTLNIKPQNIAYMGDDINDLPVMQRAAVSIAPANAVEDVKKNVAWVTTHRGGDAAVREVCDTLLKHCKT